MATEGVKDPTVNGLFEIYKNMQFGEQTEFDRVVTDPIGLATPESLDIGQHVWKERQGDTLLSVFSLSLDHRGWRGIIHGGVISGILDDIFARYCYTSGSTAIPLTKMLKVEYIKPVYPDETLFTRVTKVSTPSDDTEESRHKLWVRGNVETIRSQKVTTLVRAEALFILCKKLPQEPKRGLVSPFADRSYKRMPQDLWDRVIYHLPSLAGRYAAEAFGFRLQERHRKHSDILNHIFREDEEFTAIARRQGINLALLGDGLHTLYDDPMQRAYLALLTGDKTRNIRHDKTKLLAALKPHALNKENEIVFHDSRIVLNIEEATNNPFFITLPPEKLFGFCEQGKLRSASLYLQDNEYVIRSIGPEDIVGSGKSVSALQDVSLICGITLSHPKELRLKQRYQQCFQHMECPPSSPLCPDGYMYNGDNILGWQWEENSRP